MSSKQLFVIASFLILLLGACGTKKKMRKDYKTGSSHIATTKTMDKADNLKQSLVNQLVNKDFQFDYLNIKTKGEIKLNNAGTYKVNLDVRFKKDEVIWISVQAILGIELFRIMIDQESIQWINKIQKTYQSIDTKSYAEDPKLFIGLIQQIFMASVSQQYGEILKSHASLKDTETPVLSYQDNFVNMKFNFDANTKIHSLDCIVQGKEISFSFPVFGEQSIDGQNVVLPSQANISFKDQNSTVELFLTYNKISRKESHFPFSVPNKSSKK